MICMCSCAYGDPRLFKENYIMFSCEDNQIVNEPLLVANTYYRNVARSLGFLVLQAFGPILTVLMSSCSLICELQCARLECANLNLN